MKNKAAYWIVVIVLVAVVVSERFTISRVRRERDAVRQEKAELEGSLFAFHNMYTSQMDSLIRFLCEMQNDDFVDIRTVYDTDVSATQKLSSFRSLTHRRNTLCGKAIKETGDYILYARKEYAVRASERERYSRLLRQGDNGELVLKVDPVTKFDLMSIEKYQR